jgi:hypothetical protein
MPFGLFTDFIEKSVILVECRRVARNLGFAHVRCIPLDVFCHKYLFRF